MNLQNYFFADLLAFLTYKTGKLHYWKLLCFFILHFCHFLKISLPVRFTKPNTRSYNEDVEIGDGFYV